MNDILVVENDLAKLGALTDVLAASGRSVTPARNGKEALECIRAGARPRLVLFDMASPAVEGWDFMRQQRTDPFLSGIPVISISASISDKPNGIRELRTNPVDVDGLLALVGQYC
jgi:CheY-like chemotaxis protein